MPRDEKIGIIGSGLIGRSWAMLFAGVGYQVMIYDVLDTQITAALEDINKQLKALEKDGMLRGTLTAEEQFKCIKGVNSLKECVRKAKHIQECIPENLELKIKVFKELDALAGPNTVLCSSTSCIVPSKFTEDLAHKTNCVVAHPVNPPYYVALVEIVPAPWTSKDVVTRTRALMKEIGQAPVTLSREMPGFGLNRIQYAILNECSNLVSDGVLSAEDVDTLMSEGLGMRYAWMGPLETAHLNAEGMMSYVERYGSTIASVSSTFKPVPAWSPENSQALAEQCDKMVPVEQLQSRRQWRDARLAKLAKLKKEMKELE